MAAVASNEQKRPTAPMHPFVYPPGYYPGQVVGTPPVDLPEQDPATLQGAAEGGLYFSESELPVSAVSGRVANEIKAAAKRAADREDEKKKKAKAKK